MSLVDDGVPPDDDSFPLIGCSVKLIVDFVEEHGGKPAFHGLTTDDVKTRFVLSETAVTQQSLCQQLHERGDKRIGRPSFFVSHAWKYPFLNLVQVRLRPFYLFHPPPLSSIRHHSPPPATTLTHPPLPATGTLPFFCPGT
jgi:hypothetical protein